MANTNDLQSIKGLFSGFQDSVKLALSTIKNQDPLDPQDATELGRTFFSMATAVGMNAISDSLNANAAIQQENQLLTIGVQSGKMAEMRSDKFHFDPSANNETLFGIDIPNGIAKAKLLITDQNGIPQFQADLSTKNVGKEFYEWDGRPNTQEGLRKAQNGFSPAGNYNIKVLALDGEGNQIVDKFTNNPINIPTTVKSTVTGGARVDNTNMITINGLNMPISDLIMLHEAAPKIPTQPQQTINNQDEH